MSSRERQILTVLSGLIVTIAKTHTTQLEMLATMVRMEKGKATADDFERVIEAWREASANLNEFSEPFLASILEVDDE